MLLKNQWYARLDQGGVVLLPESLLEKLELKPGDPFQITIGPEGEVVLRGPSPRCAFCGERNLRELSALKGRYYCRACFQEMAHAQEAR